MHEIYPPHIEIVGYSGEAMIYTHMEYNGVT